MIFVNTSALNALFDRDDENHPLAKSTWRSLLHADEALIVTNYVVVETTALARRCIQNEMSARSTFNVGRAGH